MFKTACGRKKIEKAEGSEDAAEADYNQKPVEKIDIKQSVRD